MTTPANFHTTMRLITQAADTFLRSLGVDQRDRAKFDFDSTERENWHYVPRLREGLPRGDMNPKQLAAAEALMAASLSVGGLGKANSIIQHETILGEIEASQGTLRHTRLPDLYHFSVFGTPGTSAPWGWQVDGHHLSLNMTVVNGGEISVTPSFFGANPAEVRQGPHRGLRILKEEEDMARSLLQSLDEEQVKQCTIFPTAPPDLITRNSRSVELGGAVGLPAHMMTNDQRERLVSLIKVYIDRKPLDIASINIRKIDDAGLSTIWFGWAGSPHRGQPHYYRVHGPTFLIEYDNTQNMANHIHSVWRDIEGDFGRDILREHYRQSH